MQSALLDPGEEVHHVDLEIGAGQIADSRVQSSRLLSEAPSLALMCFQPRLHEPVEFLHLFVGVGFGRAVFQPTEHVSFDQVARHIRMLGMETLRRLRDRKPFPVKPDDHAPLGVDLDMVQCVEDKVEDPDGCRCTNFSTQT